MAFEVKINRDNTGKGSDFEVFDPFDSFDEADALAVSLESANRRAVVLVEEIVYG